MTQQTQTRKQNEIQQATVNRVVDPATHKTLGYLVRSDSSEQYYQVTYNRQAKCYECQCKDHLSRHRDCKHILAVKGVGEARKEMKQEQHIAAHAALVAAYLVIESAYVETPDEVAARHDMAYSEVVLDLMYEEVGDPRIEKLTREQYCNVFGIYE